MANINKENYLNKNETEKNQASIKSAKKSELKR